MKLLKLLIPLSAAWIVSCDTFGRVRPGGVPVSEAYAGTSQVRILDVESPLRVQPRIPVLSTPEVFAVYVPSHTERDLLIGEHWIFFKLRDAEWFIERLQDPDPPAAEDVPVEEMKPIRELDWGKIVVPSKERQNP